MSDAFNGWTKVGPVLCRDNSISCSRCDDIEIDLFVGATGWDDRNLDFVSVIPEETSRGLLFDFRLDGEVAKKAVEQLGAVRKNFSAFLPIKLREAYRFEENLSKIKSSIQGEIETTGKLGSASLFIDITTFPKYYIQAFASWVLSSGVVGRVFFGYAEGDYSDYEFLTSSSQAVEFVPVDGMSGSNQAINRKVLCLILGTERANCYSLIEAVSPDEIILLRTESLNHPQFGEHMDAQCERIRLEYPNTNISISTVGAFQLDSFFKELKPEQHISKYTGTEFITFAASTKILALGVGILGAAYPKKFEARARRTKHYPSANVKSANRYHIIEAVDLRNPSLPASCIWSWDTL